MVRKIFAFIRVWWLVLLAFYFAYRLALEIIPFNDLGEQNLLIYLGGALNTWLFGGRPPEGQDSTRIILFFILFLGAIIVSLVQTQWRLWLVENEIPTIKVSSSGVEKEKYLSGRNLEAAYVEFFNPTRSTNKTIAGVLPTVKWFDVAEPAGFLTKKTPEQSNNGRWWISNEPAYTDTTLLQSVNLDPNGLRRRLYIAKKEKDATSFDVWFRTQDNKQPDTPLRNFEYIVEIELFTNSRSAAKFNFKVTNSPEGLKIYQVTAKSIFVNWAKTQLKKFKRPTTKEEMN